MIEKRTRKELYDKFRQGAIPSGADFADFIRSQVNLLDDGVDISEDPKNPICLKSHGEDENILDFADADGRKRWRISGRNEEGTEEGLNIKADEKSKVYIERETGNVGINTDQPNAKVHIIQTGDDDVIRIDDESNDTTPFVITSEGQVGIGIGSGDEKPQAKLHINYDGAGDVLRVNDTNNDTTPFIIDQNGNVGLGCTEPLAKLTVLGGGVSIGNNTKQPGSNSLYVEGDIEVGGSVVLSGGIGGIEINGPLFTKTEKLVLKDNVEIIAGTSDNDKSSDGNLSVAGDTTLGTYNTGKVVIINGSIESGGIPNSSTDQQDELEINHSLIVNRESLAVNVKGDLSVVGNSTLGENQETNIIKLNGTIKREGNKDVTIDNTLLVKRKATIESALIKDLTLNAGVTVNEISNDSRLADNSQVAIPTEQAVKEYVDNLLAGSIVAFAISTVPEGWFECDGRPVSRITYGRLFRLIGVTYGEGDGNTTFNLPDLRNQFLRGHVRNSRDISKFPQPGSIQTHAHTFTGTNAIISGGNHSHADYSSSYSVRALYNYNWACHHFSFNPNWGSYLYYDSYGRTTSESHSHSFSPSGSVNPSGSNETRPENMAVMFCIKY